MRAVEALPGALMLTEQYALPEAVDAAVLDLAVGAGQRDLLLEDRDASAVDAEHFEKTIPEALRLRAFGPLAFPFARKRKGARLDLVPGKRHEALILSCCQSYQATASPAILPQSARTCKAHRSVLS